jgi:eukaryotic-like serine/threonine-protein kinase
LAGTLAYLSPEGARGEWATPASDVYAAGVMLFAALTGEVPFTGTIAEGVGTLRATPVPRASSYDASLVDLDAFLAQALATRPQDRCADGGEALTSFRRARGAGHAHPTPDRMGP